MDRFGKIANRRKDRFNPKESDTNIPCIELECLSQETGILLSILKSKEQKSIKNVFSKNDVLFGKLRPYLRKFLKPNFDGVCSSEIWVLKGNLVCNDYLYYLIQTDKFNYEVNQTSGSKMPRADWNYISEIRFGIPENLTEQEKIAFFLTKIDSRIQTSNKIILHLESLIKGFSQKLFSQQIRFKDDNGNDFSEWETKKVNSVLNERNNKAPKSKTHPLMAFVANIGVTHKGERYNREFLVNKGNDKKYKQTEYGDFIYSSNNLETGSIGLNRFGSASISPVYSIFKIKESFNIDFISRYFVRIKFIGKMKKFRQGVVYGQWRIHESDFLKIEDNFPSLEEQTKIANFLSSLDAKLEKEKQLLEQYKQQKKYLLQNLFI